MVKLNNMGILNEIYENKPFIYESLTIESISKIMDSIRKNINVLPKQPILYVSELMHIRITVINNNTDLAKQINKLFSYLPYYTHIENLYIIKAHHICVGHSTMTMEERNIKNRYFLERKNNIENKIKELYYGKS